MWANITMRTVYHRWPFGYLVGRCGETTTSVGWGRRNNVPRKHLDCGKSCSTSRNLSGCRQVRICCCNLRFFLSSMAIMKNIDGTRKSSQNNTVHRCDDMLRQSGFFAFFVSGWKCYTLIKSFCVSSLGVLEICDALHWVAAIFTLWIQTLH